MVSFLETGDAARASIELDTFEVEGGDPATFAYWKTQIDGDPETLFESDGTVHKIRPGESLSSISRSYLGDPLQFYLLARFNQIENPSQITAGQVIRIPKLRPEPVEPRTPPAKPPAPSGEAIAAQASPTDPQNEPPAPEVASTEPPPSADQVAITATSDIADEAGTGSSAATSQTSAASRLESPAGEAPGPNDSVPDTPPETFDQAARSAEQGEMESAIALLEDGLKRYPGNLKVRRAAILAYSKHGEFLLANGKPEQAAVTLAKAVDLDPEDQAITAQLQAVRNRIQAEAFYQKGLRLRDGGDAEAALAAFGKALEIAPDFRDAQDQFGSLQSDLVDRLQREAIVALRQEDFPTALDLWRRVLDIDATNGTADRYYRHTLELQRRQADTEAD